MEYKLLGHSDLQISRIGFGCMSLKPDQTDIQELIESAIGAGINYFDTADLYDKGLNELQVGNALKAHRNKIIIATKGGNEWKQDGSGWDWNPRKEYLLKAVEGSLQRLKTDHIDLYQLHGGTIDDPIDETIEAFELMVQQGKIRYYGISSIRPNVISEYVKRSRIVSVMLQYSLLDRRPEETLLPLLADNRIGVLARGTVASGLLIDKPAKPYLGYSAQEVAKLISVIRELTSRESSTAINYVLQHHAVTAAIVGIRTLTHLQAAIESLTKAMSSAEITNLQQVLPPNLYKEHR